MAETKLGQVIESWSDAAKIEFKDDLNKLPKLPLDILRRIVEKLARTLPACNPADLVAVEAEEAGFAQNRQDFSDVISVFVYIWENAGDKDSPRSIVADLNSLSFLSKETASILENLLTFAQPFRENAKAQSSYIKIGAPLFVTLRGVVDLRLRFHKTDEEFVMGAAPTALVGTQQVIMVDLTLKPQEGKETTISFCMDENDLTYMKRFVKHMERELELSKGITLRMPER